MKDDLLGQKHRERTEAVEPQAILSVKVIFNVGLDNEKFSKSSEKHSDHQI